MDPDWQLILKQSTALRHWFHRHPELTWHEVETAQRIRARLDELEIPWRPCAGYGTVASLAAGAGGRHLAFRSDMDALPVTEASGVDYSSTVPGHMHACGHDGHMAALLACAAWFKPYEDDLPGPVSLVFQPAEEGGHGAKKMIEDGALNGIDCIYGWHNWPALPLGKGLCPEGPVMSGNGTFHMTIQGKGGHASQPEVARDPVLAAAAITMNLQQIVSRRMPPQAAVVISVTNIVADDGVTVIPDSVRLEGGIRFSEPRWQVPVNEMIREISHATGAAYGVRVEIEVRPRYQPTVNHAGPAGEYRQALRQALGDECLTTDLPAPVMASEDFSYYLNEIPGAFALIGISEDNVGGNGGFEAPCHSPEYVFNDRVLASMVGVFSRLAGISPPPV